MTAQRRWTRKRTYGEDREDWVVLRDGVVVGRVMLDEQQEHPVGEGAWEWTVITMPALSGSAESMEEALEEVRRGASDDWAHVPHGWPVDR